MGQRFVVLAVSVVYRGCAMPVAWVILPAGAKPAWRRAWRRLRRLLRPAMPRGWTVIVLADRGLSAPWRLRRITRLGWHPCRRSNTGGSFRPVGSSCGRPFTTLVPRPGTSWRGMGLALTRHPVACTWLARWEAGYTDPGLLLTALPPEARDAGWDGLRAWIEPGVKSTTRAGWQWHRTRLSAPARAARLWLAVAVATWWLLRVGEAVDETMPASTRLDVTALCPGRLRTRRATRLRLVSVCRHGWVERVVALLRHEPLPQGRFMPAPWPAGPALTDEAGVPVLALPAAA